MRYIIEQPIIADNSIVVMCHEEGNPGNNYSCEYSNVSPKDMEHKLKWAMEAIARKMAIDFFGRLDK